MSKFLDFIMLKESNNKGISSEVKLSDNSDYKPFHVGDNNHPNLKVLVNAFNNSDKIHLPGPDGTGHMKTLDQKGENSPKLRKKSLYLVGGAVRDHLSNKTPKDYDLATNATPDEIRLILRAAGFTETKPQTGKHAPKDPRYDKHPETANKNKIFYAKGWDRAGTEFVIGAKVNGEEFEIATFRKDSKGGDGRTPDKMEFTPNFDEDSARRDFTINSMGIPLTNADGPNTKLLDPHGGAHHLKAGEVKFVGNAKDRLQEDQLRALRYIRFVARTGNADNIPAEYKDAIKEIKDLPSVSRERIKEEFVKGLEHPDVDPRKYIKIYKDLGLLETVFPGMTFQLDKSKDFSDKKDKRLQIAWILRNNNPVDVEKMLDHSKWDRSTINDIIHLIKMHGWGGKFNTNPEETFDKFHDMKTSYHKTSLVPSIIKSWGQMTGLHDDLIHNYLNHDLSTKGYVNDAFGNKVINPELVNVIGRVPKGKEFGDAIKKIETDKFRSKFASKDSEK